MSQAAQPLTRKLKRLVHYSSFHSILTPVAAENSESSEKAGRFRSAVRNVVSMLALVSTLLSWLACRFRSRAELRLAA